MPCVFLDYIAVPCSQEDDIHNVQSVIDSLSLDYLQISLSHITGKLMNTLHVKEKRNLTFIHQVCLFQTVFIYLYIQPSRQYRYTSFKCTQCTFTSCIQCT